MKETLFLLPIRFQEDFHGVLESSTSVYYERTCVHLCTSFLHGADIPR